MKRILILFAYLLCVHAAAVFGASPRAAANRDPQAELVLDPQGFSSAVAGLAFRPDGKWLAAAGNKEVRIWDTQSGELVATLRGQQDKTDYGSCFAVAFSPDGRSLVVGIDDYSSNGSIRVYDTRDLGQIRRLLPGHQAPVRRLAFSHDGKYLASAGENGRIIFWNWSELRYAGSVEPRDPRKPSYRFLEFPTDAPMLLVGEAEDTAVVSVPSGTRLSPQSWVPDELRRWLAEVPKVRFPFGGAAGPLSARLERGAWLAGVTGKENGADVYCVGSWKADGLTPMQVYQGHRYAVTAVALDPAARLAASADAFGEIHLWDTATGKALHVFRGAGQPVYRVAFDSTGKSLGFGTRPYSSDRWDRNQFGPVESVWRFETRGTRPASDAKGYRLETPAVDDLRLTVEQQGSMVEQQAGTYALAFSRGGKIQDRYKVRVGGSPMCYTFLRPNRLGIPDAVVLGDDSGGLWCYDPRNGNERRIFAGHEAFVTSVSQSPDGRFLASSSTDGTMRIWSLENYHPVGEVDFRYLSDTVTEVKPFTSAARAGVRVGDRFVSMDGRDRTELERLLLEGKYPYRPRQRVKVQMERDGSRYEVELVLREGADIALPLASIFQTRGNDWIVWTPQGYYDASPGGDRLIGWHVNQGPARAAKYYSAHQFRTALYRPDIIDRVFQLGNVEEAIRQANATAQRPVETVDLRQSGEIAQREPPRVKILEPAEGVRVQAPKVTLRAEVTSRNRLPIREVTVLVNGRPLKSKGVRVERVESDDFRSVVEEVPLLPGDNEIGVIAANASASSKPSIVRVNYQAAQPAVALPDLYLLTVGISRYSNSDYNLQFGDRDAEAFAAAWKEQKGQVYREVHAKVLTNDQASMKNILAGMEWLVRSATQRDVVVVFLSAHGLRDDRQNYFLATHEIDPKDLRSTGVRFTEVKQMLRDLPCKVLLFADTCHSGGITGAKAADWNDPLMDLVSEEYGAIVFASSLPRETSLEDPKWGHGAFTRALIDALKTPAADYNHDGYLSVTELENYVAQRVKQLTEGRQHPVVDRPPTVRNFAFYKFARSLLPGAVSRAANRGPLESRL